jgi:hypothetical protein
LNRFNHLLAASLIVLLTLSRSDQPALSAELIMLEEPGCGWCRLWLNEIGPGYPKTDEGRYAPLRRLRRADLPVAGVTLRSPVVSTPTFVLVENKREVGRITGYPGADFFYGLLGELLVRSPDWKRAGKSGT